MQGKELTEKIAALCLKCWEEAGKGKILLAVSGGADSVALLLAFSQAGIPMEAVHCNFNLRGDESDRDRDFVKDLCGRLQLKLHIAEFNTTEQAVKGESVEMTCRRLRYDYFRKLKKEGGFSRIAVAHNADDNIETFFMNALRGSGSRGLKGMEQDNGEILRPLLQVSRKDILGYLAFNNQSYVTDSSNLESEYRRNFLRNEIFPLLESRWEGFRKAMKKTMEIQARENKIVEQAIKDILDQTNDTLRWEVISRFADPQTLIFYFIQPWGGTPVIAEEMARSARMPVAGKRWELSCEAEAYFTRQGITIRRLQEMSCDTVAEWEKPVWKSLKPDREIIKKIKNCPPNEIYLPYDESHYCWNVPDKETRIKTLGLAGSQNVMKVLKDAGVAAFKRRYYPILSDKETGETVWIPGIKRSRLHLVSEESQEIYHCRFPEASFNKN